MGKAGEIVGATVETSQHTACCGQGIFRLPGSPPPRPLRAMGGGGNATEEATAGMRGDPDEFRCALFRSRQLQRQQQQAWLQQAFAGWDWASFARKAREHRAAHRSKQRRGRLAALACF